MTRAGELRVVKVASALGIAVLQFSFSATAWSQTNENYDLSSSISDRFERGEFGQPLGEVRRQSATQAALANAPQPQYVYYIVPCDVPGAIRAGSPSILDPNDFDGSGRESAEDAPSQELAGDGSVCVALVDENRTDSPPLLYTYDSSYRYPDGYPNHYRSDAYSRTYAGSINVGYSSSRRYGALRYGLGHYGRYPHGVGHYGGFPYGIGPYGGHSYGPYYGYSYGPFPYGAYSYTSPYVSHHHSLGFSVSHYGRSHYSTRHHGLHSYRLRDSRWRQ